ncbi:outer membrane beta-barrel protein [Marinobacter xestospongiae]|uniref:Outer membrane beta-barrel protein n=1 Tax=Marinobacter xestospongiae TaxID=994319 RepID=A0ABU3W2X7_9GAMM|nr:outer membrane beta-barrel protein [Marinobacter xestospongiae]MDV2080776.1 outer membrane beta-barrel protein [Marinobacter xestospongiae]
MTKQGITGVVLASVLASTAAHAELGYTYAEGGLAMLDTDTDDTLFGVDGRGSYQINRNIFAYGGLRFLSDDLDYTNWYLGGAYRHALDARTDVWGGANLEYQEVEADNCRGFSGCSKDDVSPAIRGGIRHQLDDRIEVGASARYVSGDLDYFGLTGQGRYKIQRNLSATAELDIQDGELGLFGGVTLFF